MTFSGQLETHWTILVDARRTPERLQAIADELGLKITHVLLDRGEHRSQPMLTRRRRSELAVELADAQSMAVQLENRGLDVLRVKIEASLDATDVPRTDDAAKGEATRCFEHHVRVRWAGSRDLAALRAIATAHHAHLSQSVWRQTGDDEHERFVTQRCYGVGLDRAERALDALVASLRAQEHADVLDVQREYVVYDSNVDLDAGWLSTTKKTSAKAASYPSTFHAVPSAEGEARAELFDPALKHFRCAFKKGAPAFTDETQERAQRVMRRRALEHVLRAVASSSWSELLVLRGSILLETWLGADAREPGDMDWVVDPPSLTASDAHSVDMLRAIVELVGRAETDAGLHIATRDVAIDAIWTYERAEGRRIVFPWTAPGLPGGAVQLDFVFQEPLAVPPQRLEVVSAFGPPISVRAASPELSLAWKLLWLSTDFHPQGKDLYDATLLAEKFGASRGLIERVMRSSGDGERVNVHAEMPMAWGVEWEHLLAEMPWVEGSVLEWKTRLSKALARTLG